MRMILPAALAALLAAAAPGDSWPEAAAYFQKHGTSKDPKERANAASKLSAGMDGKHDKQAVNWLIALLANECNRDKGGKAEEAVNGDVLLACEKSLKLPTTADASDIVLDQARKHPNIRTRFHLIRALGALKDPAAVKALTDLVDDKNPIAVVAACDALAERGDESTLDTALKVLKNAAAPWEAKIGALAAVGKINQPDRSVETLIELLGALQADEGRLKLSVIAMLGSFCGVKEPKSDDANWWKTAWAAKKAGRDPEKDQGTTTDPVEFFGIKALATRMVFILDKTGSLEESCTLPEDPPDPPKPSPGPEVETGPGTKKPPPAEEAARKRALEIKKKWDAVRGKKKIEGLKKMFLRTIWGLDSRVWFTVIWYEETPTYWRKELVPATWANKLDIMMEVDKLQATGPTNIFEGIESALKMIESTAKKGLIGLDKKANYAMSLGGADTFFLMTDGIHNRGKFVRENPPGTDTEGFVAEVRKIHSIRKVAIHVVALGDITENAVEDPNAPGFNEKYLGFLKQIADETGGSFAHVGLDPRRK